MERLKALPCLHYQPLAQTFDHYPRGGGGAGVNGAAKRRLRSQRAIPAPRKPLRLSRVLPAPTV
jgi:hypothetical protein